MEMPFEIQRGNIPAVASHPVINKSTIFGQKLKVKNTIHHEWKPPLKFTISFLFKQRVYLRHMAQFITDLMSLSTKHVTESEQFKMASIKLPANVFIYRLAFEVK
jgi:hypothetical protein